MNTDKAIREIIDYCKEWIEDFQERADLAVSKSWRERCPIECADYSLASEIVDKIDEWCTDNDCESLCDNITVEDIILNM